jgi:hypothetical protein
MEILNNFRPCYLAGREKAQKQPQPIDSFPDRDQQRAFADRFLTEVPGQGKMRAFFGEKYHDLLPRWQERGGRGVRQKGYHAGPPGNHPREECTPLTPSGNDSHICDDLPE